MKMLTWVLTFMSLFLFLTTACTTVDNLYLATLPRPQEPKGRPYIVGEVTIPGGEPGVNLAGELCLPKGNGPFPGVVLISGSEPVDRNSKILGHRPFLVLSDFLTRHGYGVYRYDVRGYGKSSGDTSSATDDDFAADAAAALKWLRAQEQIDAHRAGFIGHSQGGIKAPLAAAIERPDFIISLAGGAQTVAETLLLQRHEMGKEHELTEEQLAVDDRLNRQLFELLRSSRDAEDAQKQATRFLLEHGFKPKDAKLLAQAHATPWMMAELDRDVASVIKAYDGPLLAMFGGKDLLVSAKINAPLMESLLSHPASKVVVLPGLNHFFQPAIPGGVEEIWKIETTIDPKALDVIAHWLEQLVG